MTTISTAQIASPPAPLAPPELLRQRLELRLGDEDQDKALMRLLLSVTAQIERACGRAMVRREHVVMTFDAREAPPPDCPWPLWESWPVETIHTLHVDLAARHQAQVSFDSDALLVEGEDYSLLPPITAPGPHELVIGSARHPHKARFRGRVIRIEATFGYRVRDEEGEFDGDGDFDAPPDLEEACLMHAAKIWMMRERAHLRSQSETLSGGGGGTTAFAPLKLDEQTIDLIRPYATHTAAMQM